MVIKKDKKNAYFEWSEDFVTGIDEIDEQHHGLVELINELFRISLEEDKLDFKVISEVKERLEKYVVTHFTYEETLMKRYSINKVFRENHILQHREFVSKVSEYFSSFESIGDNLEFNSIVEYFIRWLAYHILNVDKSLVRQITYITVDNLSAEEAYIKENEMNEYSSEPLLKALKVLYRLISQKNIEIESKNRELELRVSERTKELEVAYQKLKDQNLRDTLTGLKNRRYVMQELENLINVWERYQTPFSILYIDIDHFKKVNDHYGHEMGDQVLLWFSNHLDKNTRKTDVACRLGGDEFLVICPHTTGEEALVLGRKLNDFKQDEVIEKLELWKPSISIGIREVDDSIKEVSDLLQHADTAMYKSKLSGGGRVTSA